ncbi:MAG: 16S rRNA (uracil(1498)-N(3))-methyltransferase [Clostridiales bacterium]|jgi:16S rRNA (uracil1498-N3)-methyltransferase|nr:16S rRNA (uracil(1498)-N(3))-methyltransferase [Clostridiales bacterium]
MRFFAESNGIDLVNKKVTIRGGDAVHITGALRLKKGEIITVSDGGGTDYACEITSLERGAVNLSILKSYKSSTEPEIKVTLFQALPKFGKMELIIEKCVELGIYEIVPVTTLYTTVKINDKISEKILRFNKISESAAKQCNRAFIPKVKMPVSFETAVCEIQKLDIAIAAYENEADFKIRNALEGFSGKTAGLFIGPEGGFSESEALTFKGNKIHTVSLGKRILRTETAGFACLTIFFNETGEF